MGDDRMNAREFAWGTFDVWHGGDEADGPSEVHVVPLYEGGHENAGDCWCEPREDDGVFVHRDKLDRDGPLDPEKGTNQ